MNRPADSGGRGGIRTHGGLAPTAVFKTAALNHSATLPMQQSMPVTEPFGKRSTRDTRDSRPQGEGGRLACRAGAAYRAAWRRCHGSPENNLCPGKVDSCRISDTFVPAQRQTGIARWRCHDSSSRVDVPLIELAENSGFAARGLAGLWVFRPRRRN